MLRHRLFALCVTLAILCTATAASGNQTSTASSAAGHAEREKSHDEAARTADSTTSHADHKSSHDAEAPSADETTSQADRQESHDAEAPSADEATSRADHKSSQDAEAPSADETTSRADHRSSHDAAAPSADETTSRADHKSSHDAEAPSADETTSRADHKSSHDAAAPSADETTSRADHKSSHDAAAPSADETTSRADHKSSHDAEAPSADETTSQADRQESHDEGAHAAAARTDDKGASVASVGPAPYKQTHRQVQHQEAEQKQQSQQPEQNHYTQYMNAYLPPGDSQYTEDWTGDKAQFRKYMDQYSGSYANYSAYTSQYGGSAANYAQYVTLYASMAGASPTSGGSWSGKQASQRSAYDNAMSRTMSMYAPPDYQHFALQSVTRGDAEAPAGGGSSSSGGGAQRKSASNAGASGASGPSGAGGATGAGGGFDYQQYIKDYVGGSQSSGNAGGRDVSGGASTAGSGASGNGQHGPSGSTAGSADSTSADSGYSQHYKQYIGGGTSGGSADASSHGSGYDQYYRQYMPQSGAGSAGATGATGAGAAGATGATGATGAGAAGATGADYSKYMDQYASGGAKGPLDYVKYFEQYADNSKSAYQQYVPAYEYHKFASGDLREDAKTAGAIARVAVPETAVATLFVAANATDAGSPAGKASPKEAADAIVQRIQSLAEELKNFTRDREALEKSAAGPAQAAMDFASSHRARVEAMPAGPAKEAAIDGLRSAQLKILEHETKAVEETARAVARRAQNDARKAAREAWSRAAHIKDKQEANEVVVSAEAAADLVERHAEGFARKMEDALRKHSDKATEDVKSWAAGAVKEMKEANEKSRGAMSTGKAAADKVGGTSKNAKPDAKEAVSEKEAADIGGRADHEAEVAESTEKFSPDTGASASKESSGKASATESADKASAAETSSTSEKTPDESDDVASKEKAGSNGFMARTVPPATAFSAKRTPKPESAFLHRLGCGAVVFACVWFFVRRYRAKAQIVAPESLLG